MLIKPFDQLNGRVAASGVAALQENDSACNVGC